MKTDGKMSFKDYVFEHNPSMIQIVHRRNVVSRVIPNGQAYVGEFGVECRVVSGEGEFFGEHCVEQSERLRTVFEQGGKGVLYLPSQKPMLALFRELELCAEDTENVVAYRFVFEECGSESAEHKTNMALGDGVKSLWDFSYQSGMDIEDLMKSNEDILRPDEPIPCGKEVRLC